MDALVKFSSALKRKKLIQKAIAELQEFLKDLPDIDQFKNTDELAELCCNVVEYLLAGKAKKYKIDKREVVNQIYDQIFIDRPLTGEERMLLNKRIEFLHEHKLIKGISVVRVIRKGFLAWLQKKIL